MMPLRDDSIIALSEYIHQWAQQKGWWDEPRNFGEMNALVHTEVSEAMEAWRENKEFYIDDDQKPEGWIVEYADVCIRIFDIAAHYGYDLGAIIVQKMAYNETRPYRHGGKKA